MGQVQTVEWTTGMEYWTGLLECFFSLLKSIFCYDLCTWLCEEVAVLCQLDTILIYQLAYSTCKGAFLFGPTLGYDIDCMDKYSDIYVYPHLHLVRHSLNEQIYWYVTKAIQLFPSEAIHQRNLQGDKSDTTLQLGDIWTISSYKKSQTMKGMYHQCNHCVNNTIRKFYK